MTIPQMAHLVCVLLVGAIALSVYMNMYTVAWVVSGCLLVLFALYCVLMRIVQNKIDSLFTTTHQK